jgi:hypothetical protein
MYGFKEAGEKADIEKLAERFAAAVGDRRLSPANVQGYLMGWENDPQGAVEGVSS